MNGVIAFVSGALFAVGLGIGGMTQPPRVLGFLDVAGRWDPTLAFVMVGAVAVYAIAVRVAARQGRPLYAPTFALPTRRDVDPPLVLGAAIFGVGWGTAGLCPGPAVTALASGRTSAILFVAAMLVGMAAAGGRERRRAPVAGARVEA
jgi:uncharacterized membrane protein YedE/YeeE